MKLNLCNEIKRITSANSTLAIGGVSSPLESFVVNETFVRLIKFCGKIHSLRVAAKR
jgi:hypothetical protein